MVQMLWRDEFGPKIRQTWCRLNDQLCRLGKTNLTLWSWKYLRIQQCIRKRGGHAGYWWTQKKSFKTCFYLTFFKMFSLVAFLLQASLESVFKVWKGFASLTSLTLHWLDAQFPVSSCKASLKSIELLDGILWSKVLQIKWLITNVNDIHMQLLRQLNQVQG